MIEGDAADDQEGEHHVFKGPLQETKANEFVLVYEPETNSFVLERLETISRLAATRGSRSGNFPHISTPVPDRPSPVIRLSKSDDDIPTISLDNPSSPEIMDNEIVVEEPEEERIIPPIVTPRLPPSSPVQPQDRRRRPRYEKPESSDDDSDIDIAVTKPSPLGKQAPAKPEKDEEVSDDDLDNLANELESSMENGLESSSDDDSPELDGPPKSKPPNFGNVPRSGGPISMSRFAGGRRREEEESSSSDDDD
jgi:RNA polymerase II transcription elongation factor